MASCCFPECKRERATPSKHCSIHAPRAKAKYLVYKKEEERAERFWVQVQSKPEVSVYLKLYSCLRREWELRVEYRTTFFTPETRDEGHEVAIALRKQWMHECETELALLFRSVTSPTPSSNDKEGSNRAKEQRDTASILQPHTLSVLEQEREKIKGYEEQWAELEATYQMSMRCRDVEAAVIKRYIDTTIEAYLDIIVNKLRPSQPLDSLPTVHIQSRINSIPAQEFILLCMQKLWRVYTTMPPSNKISYITVDLNTELPDLTASEMLSLRQFIMRTPEHLIWLAQFTRRSGQRLNVISYRGELWFCELSDQELFDLRDIRNELAGSNQARRIKGTMTYTASILYKHLH